MKVIPQRLSCLALLVALTSYAPAHANPCGTPNTTPEDGVDTGCQNIRDGVDSMKVLLTCIGKNPKVPGQSQSITVLQAPKHKMGDGKIVDLTKGLIVEMNFETQHQRHVFNDGTITVAGSQAEFVGKLIETINIGQSDGKPGSNPVTVTKVTPTETKLKADFQGPADNRIPTKVEMGSSEFLCNTGRIQSEVSL